MIENNAMTWEEAIRWLKRQPDQAALVKACYYDDPLETASKRFHVSTEWAAVQHILSGRSGRALDIGAGRGISSYALARDGWSVSALEPDPSAEVGADAIRNLAASCRLDIEVVEKWGEQLPFADAQFDLVYCRAVLHHARNLSSLCAEAARVLKPGGIMLATRACALAQEGS